MSEDTARDRLDAMCALEQEVWSNPPHPEWHLSMFNGIVSVRLKPGHKVPNRFWRWMQFVCFGNRWVKITRKDL